MTSLLSAYEGAERNRALGGVRALAGFDYQLRVYLAEFAESLAAGGAVLEKAGGHFLEALSDLAKQTDDSLVCVQVKRTLTTTTLKDAATEVDAIYRFLQTHDPQVAQQVRFRLVAARSETPWQWSNVPATHPAHATLATLLSQGRLLPPEVEPDPWWRAVVAVWQQVKDPYGFLRFALERALSRDLTAADAQRIRDDIGERFKQDSKPWDLPGQLLTPADFQRNARPSRTLEIGREITLARLRDQQYMPRAHRLDALYATLLERQDLSLRDLRSEARVFWLSGRSGVGKSVLLLQTVERLASDGWRVLWLRSQAELLEPALRAIADAPDDLRPDFIAIDDLYDRNARTRLDLERLGSFIDEREHQAWPMILTCGPTEFADAFKEDSAYRGFDVHLQTIHTIAADEAAEVEAWYRERTGLASQRGPALSQTAQDDGGLFISMAVELAHGDLQAFAQRFGERVRVNGLDEALRLPLALNRLYLSTPYDWLSETDREKLATLNGEGDFSFFEMGTEGQTVRLTHPHLADALYRALRKPGNAVAYTNDLVAAFQRAIDTCDAGLVSQLLRVFSGHEAGLLRERLSIVDNVGLAQDCARSWIGNPPMLALDGQASATVSWACWATSVPAITRALGEDLLARALTFLGQAYKVWPGDWQRLAGCYPGNAQLFAWAAEHLKDELKLRHPTWSFVWEYCLEHDGSRHTDWQDMGLEWLQYHLRRPDWHIVWKRLLPDGEAADWKSTPALILGMRRLNAEQEGPDWAYVFQDLYALATPGSPQAEQLARLAWTWLAGRQERAEWMYVWRCLSTLADKLPDALSFAELLQSGVEWLAEREDRAEWSYVWRCLLEHSDALPVTMPMAGLLSLGAEWLVGREDRAEWQHVWRCLLKHRAALPDTLQLSDLKARGAAWLAGREDRAQWSHVWQELFAYASIVPAVAPVAELQRCGLAWLAGREDRADWMHVWQTLLISTDGVADTGLPGELLQLGMAWLKGRDDTESWSFVCEQLLDRRLQDPALFEQAARWLRRTSMKPEWPLLAAKFIVVAPQHPASLDFAQVLEKRIRSLPNSGHWFKMDGLISHLGGAGELPQAIRSWVRTVQERRSLPAWSTVRRYLDEGLPVKGRVTVVREAWCSVELEIGLMAAWTNVSDGVRGVKGQEYSFFVRNLTQEKETVQVGLSSPGVLVIGEVHEGRVIKVRPYGLLISVAGHVGLLHRSSCAGWTALAKAFPAGSQIDVEILELKDRGPALRYAGPDVHDSHDVEDLQIGGLYEGRVTGAQPYGVFLEIGDRSGLLHHSQLPAGTDPCVRYHAGQILHVQVKEIREDGRLSLSLPATEV